MATKHHTKTKSAAKTAKAAKAVKPAKAPAAAPIAHDEVAEANAASAGKAQAPKAPALKVAAKPADNMKITILTKSYPCRKGSNRAKMFAMYRDGMTVGEAVAAGVQRVHIRWDCENKHIKLSR
jgi:hypothetical protein